MPLSFYLLRDFILIQLMLSVTYCVFFRDNMGGTPDFDNRMLENLKNFDINSPEVKQQFGKFRDHF